MNAKINIYGKEIEFCFTTASMIKISERCGGDIGNLSNILKEKSQNEALIFMSDIANDLANGAIIKHNCAVALGLTSGEKNPELPEGSIADLIDVSDFEMLYSAIFAAMGLGSEYKIPDEVKLEEKDADLAEIEAEKSAEKKS